MFSMPSPFSLSRAVAAATVAFALVGCGPQSQGPSSAFSATAAPVTGSSAAPAPTADASAQVNPGGQPVPAAPSTFKVPAPGGAPLANAAPQQGMPGTPSASLAPAPAVAVSTASAGQISNIEQIREQPKGTGAGAVIGGVLGAVVGNQFGHGNGRAAMTVVGAAGGAFTGNTVERHINERVVGYRVSVRLDNGQSRTYQEARIDGLRVGDRVRIDGHRLRPA